MSIAAFVKKVVRHSLYSLALTSFVALPSVGNAVAVSGHYDVVFSGATPGVGEFDFDASTGQISNFLISIGGFERALNFNGDTRIDTCFVEWATTPGFACSTWPSLFGFVVTYGQIAFNFDVLNRFLFDFYANGYQDYLGRAEGTFSATLHSVPEPATLFLLASGFIGIVITRRRIA